MPTLTPEKKDACMNEIAKWYAEHKREAHFGELAPLLMAHLSPEDVDEFGDYLNSPEGSREFGKRLRLETWKEAKVFWTGPPGAGEKPLQKFPLGQIVVTSGVNELIAENTEFAEFTTESLRRHARGDWGDLSPEDKKENEYSLTRRLRLLSAYEKPPLPKIWLITEADRSSTTLLFPSEY